jgi:hypothetical protein
MKVFLKRQEKTGQIVYLCKIEEDVAKHTNKAMSMIGLSGNKDYKIVECTYAEAARLETGELKAEDVWNKT